MDPPRCHRRGGLELVPASSGSLPEKEGLDLATRRASSSVTVTQVVTFVGRRNRFILSLPLHPGPEGGGNLPSGGSQAQDRDKGGAEESQHGGQEAGPVALVWELWGSGAGQ